MPLPATIPLPGGMSMPAVGLGTFRARGEDATRAVGWALQNGYRLIDTASIYRNEAEVAAALAASGIPRAEVFLTTKISPYQVGMQAAAWARAVKLLPSARDERPSSHAVPPPPGLCCSKAPQRRRRPARLPCSYWGPPSTWSWCTGPGPPSRKRRPPPTRSCGGRRGGCWSGTYARAASAPSA